MISTLPGESKWFYEKTTSLHERFQKCESAALDLERKVYSKEENLNFTTKMNNPGKLQEYWHKIVGDSEKSIERNRKIMDKLASIDRLMLSLGGKAEKLEFLRDPNVGGKSWTNQPTSKAQLSQRWLESVSDSGFGGNNTTTGTSKNYLSVYTQTDNKISCPHCSKDVFDTPERISSDESPYFPTPIYTSSVVSHLESMFTDTYSKEARLGTAKSLPITRIPSHDKSYGTLETSVKQYEKNLMKRQKSDLQLKSIDSMPLTKSQFERSYTLPDDGSKYLKEEVQLQDESERAPTRNYLSHHEEYMYSSNHTHPERDSLTTPVYEVLSDSKIDKVSSELLKNSSTQYLSDQQLDSPVQQEDFSTKYQSRRDTCALLQVSNHIINNNPDEKKFATPEMEDTYVAPLSLSQEGFSENPKFFTPYHQQLDYENGDILEKLPVKNTAKHIGHFNEGNDFLRIQKTEESEKFIESHEASLDNEKNNKPIESSHDIWKQANSDSQIKVDTSSVKHTTRRLSIHTESLKSQASSDFDSPKSNRVPKVLPESNMLTETKSNIVSSYADDSSKNLSSSEKLNLLDEELPKILHSENTVESLEEHLQDTYTKECNKSDKSSKIASNTGNDSSDESSGLDDVNDNFFDNDPPMMKESNAYKALLGITTQHKESDSEDDIENKFAQSVMAKRNNESIPATFGLVTTSETKPATIVPEIQQPKRPVQEKIKNLSNEERERIKKKVLLLGDGFDSDLEDIGKPLQKSASELDDDFFD